MSYLTKSELFRLRLKHFGDNVLISDKCSIYGVDKISIGNNVRIDDFCLLSTKAEITIGNYVHIGAYTYMGGAGIILIDDFSSISSRVSFYSSNDDYTGIGMTNPTIPEKYKLVTTGNIHVMKHSIIGCGSIILPDVIIGEGVSIGALSLIIKDCDEFSVYTGIPAKKIGNRCKRFLKYEKLINYENKK